MGWHYGGERYFLSSFTRPKSCGDHGSLTPSRTGVAPWKCSQSLDDFYKRLGGCPMWCTFAADGEIVGLTPEISP